MSVFFPQRRPVYRQLFLVMLFCLFVETRGDEPTKPTATTLPELNAVEQVAGQWEGRFALKDYEPQSPLEKSLYLYVQQLLKACGMAAGGDLADISRIVGRARANLKGDTQRMVQEFVDAGYRRADAEIYFDRLNARLQLELVRYFGREASRPGKTIRPEDAPVSDDLLAKSETFYREKDYVGALKMLEDALRFAPSNVRLTLDTALRQQAGGQLAEARANFDLARELYPKVLNICIGMGDVRLAAHDYLGAMVDLTTAIYLQPRASRAYAKRGMARQALDDYEGAIDDYGLQIASGYRDGLESVYVRRGRAHYTLGNLVIARADFEAAIRVQPAYAYAYRELGLVHSRHGDQQASLAAFNKAVELQPDNPAGYSSRIWSHFYLGDSESALRDADRLVILGKDVAFFHMTRAVLLDVIDRPESAEAGYREAIAVAKQSRDTTVWYYASLLLDMFLRRQDRADTDYLKDVLDWPDDWPKRIALHLSGRVTPEALLNAARQAPNRLERLDHECEANFYIGMALWSAGDHPAALPYLQACALPKNTGNLEFSLAQKLLRQAGHPAVETTAKPNAR